MIRSFLKEVSVALRAVLAFVVVGGLIYSFAMTGVAQLLFHDNADGGLITKNGVVIGAKLICQDFTSTKYFQERPSAATNESGSSDNCDGGMSAADNLGPTNQNLFTTVEQRITTFRKINPSATGPVPVDLVTTSFSGLDPDITEAAAMLQAPRVASVRGLDLAKVQALIKSHVEGRDFGIFGEPVVNVLELNLALDDGAGK